MRVICINDKGFVDPNCAPIKDGETYTVCGEVTAPNGIPHYKLSEMPKNCGYAKFRFIPISDIDETEFIREYQTQTA